MEITKELKKELEINKKRLKSEIKIMVSQIQELEDEWHDAKEKHDAKVDSLTEDKQVKLDGYGSIGGKIRREWRALAGL